MSEDMRERLAELYPCTCPEVYTARGLSAPDCTWHRDVPEFLAVCDEEMERLQGELITARNRVAGLEKNGVELLARAEAAETELDRLWTPAPDSAGRHAAHCEWHTSSGAYCSCVGLTEITRLRGQRAALTATIERATKLCEQKQQRAAAGHNYMVRGIPFPVDVRVDDVLAALGTSGNPESPEGSETCGDERPWWFHDSKPVRCTLPKGHAAHRAKGYRATWEYLADEDAAPESPGGGS